MPRWKKVIVTTAFGLGILMAVMAANCGEGGAPTTTSTAHAKKPRGDVVQTLVTGTGRHVWILVVADGKTLDTQTSYKLPYTREYIVGLALKIEAKNGPTDRGSIECMLENAAGGIITHDTGYGASAYVSCTINVTA